MNVRCPRCRTLFRVDPDRVPDAGVEARCSRCGEVFAVRREDARSGEPPSQRSGDAAAPAQGAPGAGTRASDGAAHDGPRAARPATDDGPASGGSGAAGGRAGAGPESGSGAESDAVAGAAGGAGTGTGAAPAFGGQDADTRARRIARALVSDIVAYHSDRLPDDADAAAVRRAYRDEILKSWEEYVAQVGREMAEGTTHFRTALNEILAGGEDVF